MGPAPSEEAAADILELLALRQQALADRYPFVLTDTPA